MTQFESHLSLGQFLRQEREKRGISIEQVASATKIGVRQLHALESDQYSDLPARPFIRGFVISYARFVGLDPKEILTHFNSFIDSKVHERPNREAGHSGYVFEKREGTDQSRMILGIVMGSFVVLGALTIFLLKPSFLHRHKHTHADSLRAAHPHSQEAPEPAASPALANPPAAAEAAPSGPATSIPIAAAASPSSVPSLGRERVGEGSSPATEHAAARGSSPTSSLVTLPNATSAASPGPSALLSARASPSPSPAPTVAAQPGGPDPSDPLSSGHGLKPSETAHRLVVRAIETVWVRYRVDDKPAMRFPLKKGKVLVLRAKNGIVLQLGNPKDVEISHNGQGYQPAPSYKPSTINNDATLVFPSKVIDMNADLFPGEKSISSRRVTVSRSAMDLPAAH